VKHLSIFLAKHQGKISLLVVAALFGVEYDGAADASELDLPSWVPLALAWLAGALGVSRPSELVAKAVASAHDEAKAPQ
jgi:hypothetical protein